MVQKNFTVQIWNSQRPRLRSKKILAEAEKLLANILKLKMATVLRACVSVISYYKRKGQYFPHHFTNVRDWNNQEVQVAVLINPKKFGKFTAVTYSRLNKLYTIKIDYDNDIQG